MTGPVVYHCGKFPPRNLDWDRLVPLIGPASTALARYDAFLEAIPNADVLLSPLMMQEAVLSSRIEGTQATVGEVLRYQAGGDHESYSDEKRHDIEEVINYRLALRQSVDLLETLPICNRLLRKVHFTLMANVRGHDKARGEFRTIQNYIGPKNRPVEEMRFTPIRPEQLERGMGRWEVYVHSEQQDLLVQLAIIHAEFESLHPFVDGNGRIGRMLIPLFLYKRGLLREPMFYMSEYLEGRRDEYHNRLNYVSLHDDWTGWCEFFLQATMEQASQNEQRARRILDLYHNKKDWIVDATHSQFAIRALDFMFANPIFATTDYLDNVNIPHGTARRILSTLVECEILITLQESSGRRPAMYAFAELLHIADS